MIHCGHCKTINPPEQRHCQKCHRDLLPGIGALNRLSILISAGLVTALAVWVLVQTVQGGSLPDLGNCALSSPVFWGILAVASPIYGLVSALRPTPPYERYRDRAKRHLSLDKEQSLADFSQALELAPEKERNSILKERAKLYMDMGQEQDSMRDKIAALESDGAYDGASGIAALVGADKDTFVGGLQSSDREALLKSKAAVALGYCSKCRTVVQLNEKLRCNQHPRTRIPEIRLSIPEDVEKKQASMMEAFVMKNRAIHRKQVVTILAVLGLFVIAAYLMKLGPFEKTPEDGISSDTGDVAGIAFPVETDEQVSPDETVVVDPQYFNEYGFRFEYPGDWLLITDKDHRELLNGSLKGMDENSLEYLGGVYTGGLGNCSGCAQIVIAVINEPSVQGEFTDEQFQAAKESNEQSMGDRLLSYDFVSVCGLPAAESHHMGRSGETQLWEYIIVPKEPGLLYLFSMSSLIDEYVDYEPVFEIAMETLRIGEASEISPTVVTTSTPNSSPITAIVLRDTINIRSGPSKDDTIIGVVVKGQELVVLAKNPLEDWLLVSTPEVSEGWVSAPLVSLRGGTLQDVRWYEP